jgi:phosphatidylinositol alpha-1,6-mannosyltransferase
VLDPALPVGALGPHLGLPYALVLHGAEITVPGRLPGSRAVLSRVLRGAQLIVAGGSYPQAEADRAAGRTLPTVCVPPGVDTDLFVPLEPVEKVATRARLGLPASGPLVVSVSRLVPRKGMDVLIRAAALLQPRHPALTVAIAGGGRDASRLRALADRTGAPVRFLGKVPGADLPGVYGCADVVRHAVPQPLGEVSSRRASGSCSSRRPQRGCRPWPVPAAAPQTRWSTARQA